MRLDMEKIRGGVRNRLTTDHHCQPPGKRRVVVAVSAGSRRCRVCIGGYLATNVSGCRDRPGEHCMN